MKRAGSSNQKIKNIMLIEIDNMRIRRSDDRNLVLEKLTLNKDKKPIWSFVGYYGKLEDAVQAMAEYAVTAEGIGSVADMMTRLTRFQGELTVVCQMVEEKHRELCNADEISDKVPVDITALQKELMEELDNFYSKSQTEAEKPDGSSLKEERLIGIAKGINISSSIINKHVSTTAS